MSKQRTTLAPILIYAAVFLAAWALRATVLYRFDAAIASEVWRHAYSNAVKLALWVVPAWLYLRLVDRTNPPRHLKLTTRPANATFAFAATVVYLGAILLFAVFAQGRRLTPHGAGGVALASTVVSSLSEEILFRGFFLNELRERLSFVAANIMTATLFALVHLPNWLWTRGAGVAVLSDLVGVFVFACFLGYLLKKTDSLWFSFGAHAANNVLVSFLRP